MTFRDDIERAAWGAAYAAAVASIASDPEHKADAAIEAMRERMPARPPECAACGGKTWGIGAKCAGCGWPI